MYFCISVYLALWTQEKMSISKMEYWITLRNPIAIRLILHFGVISGWTILFFSLFNLISWFWLLWSRFYFVKSLAFFRVRFRITLFFLTKVKNTVSIKSFIFAYQKQYKLINFYKGNYITAIIIDTFIIAVFSFFFVSNRPGSWRHFNTVYSITDHKKISRFPNSWLLLCDLI